MIHYQIWAGQEKVGEPLPGDEAADVFRDQWELDDPDDETQLFLLPAGVEPPQRRWGP